MSLDLNFELPVCNEAPFPPPRMSNEQYIEFVEFNLRLARENGTIEQLLLARSQPVDAMFELH